MGAVISYAAGFSTDKDDDKKDGVDWLNLPCPVKYEEIEREAAVSLNPELFEGLRFDSLKPLNQKFSIIHGVSMGSVEVPALSPQTVDKVSASHYEFGANYIDNRIMLIGRILSDGAMVAGLKYDFTDSLTVNASGQLMKEPNFSQGILNLDYKGKDYQAQVKLGTGALYGLNYMQSITSTLSLGGEAFYLGHQRKSGVGFAGRYNSDKVTATAKVATTGMVALTYVQKVSDKVSLASDFMYNWTSKETTASVGYDCLLRTGRVRGRLDSNGCVSAYLEERLNLGVNFNLSAKIDHWKKNNKFGFGLSLGE